MELRCLWSRRVHDPERGVRCEGPSGDDGQRGIHASNCSAYGLVLHGCPGQTVLVQGAGGVSVLAIQIASALGARVIAPPSEDENLEKGKALGAWQTINYRKHPDWEIKALEFTDGKGVDQLLDVVGGDGPNKSIEATRVAGQIFQIGFLQGQTANVNLMRVIFRQTAIRGIAVGSARAFERRPTARRLRWRFSR